MDAEVGCHVGVCVCPSVSVSVFVRPFSRKRAKQMLDALFVGNTLPMEAGSFAEMVKRRPRRPPWEWGSCHADVLTDQRCIQHSLRSSICSSSGCLSSRLFTSAHEGHILQALPEEWMLRSAVMCAYLCPCLCLCALVPLFAGARETNVGCLVRRRRSAHGSWEFCRNGETPPQAAAMGVG